MVVGRVGVQQPPPPPPVAVGLWWVCGFAKNLGGWVPQITPPTPMIKKNPLSTPLFCHFAIFAIQLDIVFAICHSLMFHWSFGHIGLFSSYMVFLVPRNSGYGAWCSFKCLQISQLSTLPLPCGAQKPFYWHRRTQRPARGLVLTVERCSKPAWQDFVH